MPMTQHFTLVFLNTTWKRKELEQMAVDFFKLQGIEVSAIVAEADPEEWEPLEEFLGVVGRKDEVV
jgi:hypothetical protein